MPKSFRYLEIGSYEGNSALYVSNNFPEAHVTCVDLWEAVGEYKGNAFDVIEKNFDSNIRGLHNVNKIKDTSDNFFTQNQTMFDFIYVDGNHKFDYVLRDCINAWRFLNKGGFLVCDDYIWNYYKELLDNPCYAINSFIKKKNDEIKVLLVTNSQIFIKKI